jgi:hypothetical protein
MISQETLFHKAVLDCSRSYQYPGFGREEYCKQHIWIHLYTLLEQSHPFPSSVMAAVFKINYCIEWHLNAWMIPEYKGCSCLVQLVGRQKNIDFAEKVFFGWAAHCSVKG